MPTEQPHHQYIRPRCCLGKREAARLSFAGEDIRDYDEKRMSRLRGDRMAMIFQEPMTSLNPAYTVGSQMTEVLRRHRGTPRAQAVAPATLHLR
jgi:ABC-type microcin C transport system duplicated ATPase subunit YejF